MENVNFTHKDYINNWREILWLMIGGEKQLDMRENVRKCIKYFKILQ